MRSRLLLLVLGVLLLSGCASSPEAAVREDVRDVLAAANDEDVDATEAAIEVLLSTLREQVGSGEMTAAEAAPVRDAAIAVRESLGELEEVEPTPEPTQTQEPEPSPSEEPSPTPTPSATPSPTPSPTPTPEPEETEPPAPSASPSGEPETPEETAPAEGDDEQATVVPALPATPTPAATPAVTPAS